MVANLNKNKTAEIFEAWRDKKWAFNKKEIKSFYTNLAESLMLCRYPQALNCIYLCVLFDSDNFTNKIRSKGLFRYSRYNGKRCIIASIAEKAKELLNQIHILDNKDSEYLDSVVNFSFIHNTYRQLHLCIKKLISEFYKKYNNRSIIKTLITYAEHKSLHHLLSEIKHQANQQDIKSKAKEEILSGVSYLIYLSHNPKEEKSVPMISPKAIVDGYLDELITLACFIEEYKEMEVLVEHFEYTLTKKNEAYELKHPNEDFEFVYRSGFIRNDIQQMNDSVLITNSREFKAALSSEEVVELLTKFPNPISFDYTETFNYPRYSLNVNLDALISFLNYLRDKSFFLKEEIFHLNKVFKEQLLLFEDLEGIVVKDSLTLMDYILCRRPFIILREAYKVNFGDKDIQEDIFYRSLVPEMKEDKVYDLYDGYISEEKLTSFLERV